MALMSILDDRRVFFAASHGISGEPDQQRSDTAEASYCRYVVALDDVLMVNDSLSEDLVKTHSATISGGVRAYLGVPLRIQRLLPRLVLRRPRAPAGWTTADVDALRTFAETAMQSPDVVSSAQQFWDDCRRQGRLVVPRVDGHRH